MPLHIEVEGGGFHAKGACVRLQRDYVAVKVNSVLLYDGADGRLLAILDSMEITSKRTAATTALAAQHLARADARTVAICGCGEQGRAQLAAIARVRPLEHVHAWDRDPAGCDIIVTATTSHTPFLTRECVEPGAFIAAVGADNPHKSELHPDLFRNSKVVVDSFEQAAAMGDLHHAGGAAVHAELAEIVAGRKPGRTGDDEIIIFDSTGLAIQDVAGAALAHERFIA